MHDTDGDGLLSFDELVAVYQQDQGTEADGSDGATAARQAVEAYLEIADKDKNGRISFEEFKSSLDLPFEPEHADGGSDTPLNFQE